MRVQKETDWLRPLRGGAPIARYELSTAGGGAPFDRGAQIDTLADASCIQSWDYAPRKQLPPTMNYYSYNTFYLEPIAPTHFRSGPSHLLKRISTGQNNNSFNAIAVLIFFRDSTDNPRNPFTTDSSIRYGLLFALASAERRRTPRCFD